MYASPLGDSGVCVVRTVVCILSLHRWNLMLVVVTCELVTAKSKPMQRTGRRLLIVYYDYISCLRHQACQTPVRRITDKILIGGDAVDDWPLSLQLVAGLD